MHHETAYVQSTKHEMTTATLDDDTAQPVQAPSVPLCRLLCLAAGGIVCRSGRAVQPAQPKTAERRRRAQRRHARRLLDSLCSLARHPAHPGSSQAPLFSIKVARTPLQPQSTPMALTRPVCGRGSGSSAQGPIRRSKSQFGGGGFVLTISIIFTCGSRQRGRAQFNQQTKPWSRRGDPSPHIGQRAGESRRAACGVKAPETSRRGDARAAAARASGAILPPSRHPTPGAGPSRPPPPPTTPPAQPLPPPCKAHLPEALLVQIVHTRPDVLHLLHLRDVVPQHVLDAGLQSH